MFSLGIVFPILWIFGAFMVPPPDGAAPVYQPASGGFNRLDFRRNHEVGIRDTRGS